ncbi:hypothetical protein Taro_042824 [Colocasia esculenta]|uniref:Uncharacterized protein n=1 Tax=Colocasia esculenta TaxID=4460 RepID=A0A843WTW5_COLES|nr:hypothetical protein [Colocasia esculenta]
MELKFLPLVVVWLVQICIAILQDISGLFHWWNLIKSPGASVRDGLPSWLLCFGQSRCQGMVEGSRVIYAAYDILRRAVKWAEDRLKQGFVLVREGGCRLAVRRAGAGGSMVVGFSKCGGGD